MAIVVIRATKIDKALAWEPGPLYLGLMRAGIVRGGHLSELPTFHTHFFNGRWDEGQVLRFARLQEPSQWLS